jgi:CBS domain-containing protein
LRPDCTGAYEIFTDALIGGLWLIFIGLFVRSAALGSHQRGIVDQMLGRLRVRDIIVSNPGTLSPDLTMNEVVEQYFLGYGGFPVVSNGQVLGLLSLSQVRNCPAGERSSRHVRKSWALGRQGRDSAFDDGS